MSEQLSMELTARPLGDAQAIVNAPQEICHVLPTIPINPTIEAILSQAVQAGRTGAELQSLLDVFERMQATKREVLFNAAFTAFKKNCPPVQRLTKDEYITVTRAGVRVPRMYASLDDISITCDPHLHAAGLTYDWGDAVLTPDGSIIRRFILRHEAGHSRSTTSPPIPIEGGAAYKAIDAARKATSASPQQRMGVADTYAKRYSMTSGLGIPTCDVDDDAGGPGGNGATIAEEQQNTLNDLILSVGESRGFPVDRERFLKKFNAEKLADMRVADLPSATAALEQQRKASK